MKHEKNYGFEIKMFADCNYSFKFRLSIPPKQPLKFVLSPVREFKLGIITTDH